MPSFVASIDCGTTSTRFIIFDEYASIIASHQLEFEQLYPHPGWMEQRPQDLLTSVHDCISKAVKDFVALGHKVSDIKAVGITNQRETTVVWDKTTGEPLYNAIAWPDTRTTATVRKLESKSPEGVNALKHKTGLPISTYFAGVKLNWILEHVPEVKKAQDEDRLQFGTVDTWLLYNLTGGKKNNGLILTDVVNASRTMLMNLDTLEWDDELLDFFGVKRSALAKIVSNSEVYGAFYDGELAGIPIAGMIGDQQAAMVGNKCFTQGEAKNTYGTGCFMLYNTGEKRINSTHGLLTTTGYRAGPNAKTVYALEGSIAVGASSINWVRDRLGLIKETKEINELASQVPDSGGVYFVTGFSGLFAPYWDDTATGVIVGITAYTTKCHIARATLEATCFQTKAILDSMMLDSNGDLKVLKVDGGMTASDIGMQIQADILGISVERPEMRESTALGSALLAGQAVGFCGWDVSRPETLSQVNTKGKSVFESKTSEDVRKERFRQWNRAIERSKGWNENNADSPSY